MTAVFLGFEFAWFLFGLGCLAAASAFSLKPAAMTKTSLWLKARQAEGAWLLAIGVPAAVAAFKLAQFGSYQLMLDSGIVANETWNVGHGYGFVSSAFGDLSLFANHFAFTQQLFLAPLLWLWPSTAALALAQGAALGSSAVAVLLLVRRATDDPIAPCLLTALLMSQHFFHDLVGAALDDSVYALPLFLWGAYCWQTKRKTAAVACAALLLTTRESAPFVLLGIGLAWRVDSKRKYMGAPVALMIGAAVIWIVEMKIIAAAQQGGRLEHWDAFQSLGGSPKAVLALAFRRPWELALALVYPPIKLWMPAKVLLSMALLPLAGGVALVPALAAWLPHQLADAGTAYHELNAHANAFVFGPLMLAAIFGLQRARERLGPAGYRALVSGAFCVSGASFILNANFLLPPGLLPAEWRTSGPKALAMIPADSKVWCDQFFLPDLALRRYVKFLPEKLPNPWFEQGLFAPDRVLFSRHWLAKAEPATRDRLMSFYKENNFKIAFDEGDLVVLVGPKKAPEPLILR